MENLVEHVIDEITYGDILRKQRSVTRLFPTFNDRVRAVASAGGIRMAAKNGGMEKDLWNLEVHSATHDAWYQNVVKFKNMEEVIAKNVSDLRLWNKERTSVDLRFLSLAVLDDVDLDIFCSCPAFQYWGPANILTKRDAKYTEPEPRAPRIRNPKEYGAMCKHMQLVFDVLPMYGGTMSKFIKMYYMDVVKKAEEEVRKRTSGVKKAAKTLAQKEKEVKPEVKKEVPKGEEEAIPPESQQEQDEQEGSPEQ